MKFSVILLFLILNSPLAFSSACAPDTGEWAQFQQAPSDYELSGFDSLIFKKAEIHTGPQGIENSFAKPVDLNQINRVNAHRYGQFLRISFFANQKKVASLRLRLPAQWTFFQTQTSELPSETGENVMYKEIRLEGSLKYAGQFSVLKNGAPKYRLILQGSGGRCFEAQHFKNWVLQIGDTPLFWFKGSFVNSK